MKKPPQKTIAQLTGEAKKAWFDGEDEQALVAIAQIEQKKAAACQTNEEVQSSIRVAEKQLESCYRHSAQDDGTYTDLLALEVNQLKIRLDCLYKQLPRFSAARNKTVPVSTKETSRASEKRIPQIARRKSSIRTAIESKLAASKKWKPTTATVLKISQELKLTFPTQSEYQKFFESVKRAFYRAKQDSLQHTAN